MGSIEQRWVVRSPLEIGVPIAPEQVPTWLEQRLRSPWLIPASTAHNSSNDLNQAHLLAAIATYRQQLQAVTDGSNPPLVLIAEPDPGQFLAAFLAASQAQWTIVLGNSTWGDRDWQQVAKAVQPTLIWPEAGPGAPHFLPSDGAVESPLLTHGLGQHGDRPVPEIWIPTGGSSGEIKFARHTWMTLSAAVAGFQQHFQVTRIHCYCVLPLYHVSGLMQALRSLLSGGQLALQSFAACQAGQLLVADPQDWFISLVPTQLQRLLPKEIGNADDDQREWLRHFQAILLGGGAAWPSLLDQAATLDLPIALTYGMTETAAQIATLKPAEFRAGHRHCGKLLPHVQLTLLPSEAVPVTKTECSGRSHPLRIHAPSLALGYVPTSSAADSFWLRTDGCDRSWQPDDVGELDAAGYLYIHGRTSDKIITGGENVYPTEVEQAILATHLVADVAVLGLPDPHWGQRVTAFYVAIAASPDLESRLQAAIATHLAPCKRPKQWICVDRLPRNAQGKLQRSQLASWGQSPAIAPH